ncbi:MAG: hypothetical protein GEV06_04900 [Luteitalea sp.]|nr:hypothetical protein [Luteitalea sp.]
MKFVACFTFLLVFSAGTAWADRFQLLHRTDGGNDAYHVAYAELRVVDGRSQKEVFRGSTDKYGRVIIDLEKNGRYEGQVTYRQTKWRVRLDIDGSRDLKRVYVSKSR